MINRLARQAGSIGHDQDRAQKGETVEVTRGSAGSGVWVKHKGSMTFISAAILANMAERNADRGLMIGGE